MLRIAFLVLSLSTLMPYPSNGHAEIILPEKFANQSDLQWVYDFVQKEGQDVTIAGEFWRRSYTFEASRPGQKEFGPCDGSTMAHVRNPEEYGTNILVLEAHCGLQFQLRDRNIVVHSRIKVFVFVEAGVGFDGDAPYVDDGVEKVFAAQRSIIKAIGESLAIAVREEKKARQQ